ncbi:MAG: VRR-NUC domain-containing protein [Oscillospiraceae bacterium]|nr:VRR-NUC domain-containing protein [Oscillospiraceae bacterium]
MLERDITTAILRYLKTVPQCFAWKTHGGAYGTAGLPDIICCYRGRFVAFEVKTATGKPTKLQNHTIAKIKAAKGEAFIVRSVQEVQAILETLEAKYDQKGIIPAILAQPRD